MSREKRSTPKEDKEQNMIEEKLGGREVIFRKSQTADMKYLLKIYNNTKNGWFCINSCLKEIYSVYPLLL